MNTPNDKRQASAGQVERPVRSFAWVDPLCLRVRQTGGLMTVTDFPGEMRTEPLYTQAAIDAARMAGVHSVHEQTAVIVRAALELLESIEGNEPFTAEKMRAFKRVFGPNV